MLLKYSFGKVWYRGLLWACFWTYGVPNGFFVTQRLGAKNFYLRNTYTCVTIHPSSSPPSSAASCTSILSQIQSTAAASAGLHFCVTMIGASIMHPLHALRSASCLIVVVTPWWLLYPFWVSAISLLFSKWAYRHFWMIFFFLNLESLSCGSFRNGKHLLTFQDLVCVLWQNNLFVIA